ncbi:TrkH family potassium uptake protein [Tenuifilum thalassicum]|uniref:TrkH family potassium uptake protein n=1 Tax=Tenuifilum thalassicum TaxID=2590900 RepID=A0A7D3Y491_9BACT|nr:TrkH family potassium uptake protein [Tenuifilum thalassicum]QKG79849.1 TrkH family potassium uptake protein [Tenuifilum thalassicum]
MRLHVILRYIGMVMLLNAAFIFISFLISFYHRDSGQLPLLFSFLITLLWGIFPLVFVPKTTNLFNKEGYLVVVLSWILSCFFGSLPFLLYGGEFTFVKALFESVSGYTTTGASILNNVEALPKGILFWRSSMHWIGGVGIVVFVLIVLPSLGKAQMTLSKMEISPLAQEDFKFRTRKMLNIILVVYVGLTALEVILLKIFGMSLFDAINHAFATVATGGFSTKNTSIASFNSVPIELTIIVFMFLSGIHFGLLYSTLTLKKKNIFTSPIVRYYFIATIIGIVLVTFNLHGKVYSSWSESLRYASFQVVSLSTTTGFANADSSIWPPFSILIILFFTIQCACAGSTSGGMKLDRVFIFLKALKGQIKKLQHPQAVIPVRIGNKTISEDIINSVVLFIVFYILILFISTLLLTALGYDTLTSFSATAACIGNAGPGFGLVGSLSNYSTLSNPALIILSFVMLLGRLEIFGLLLLFMVKSWR